MCPSIEPLETIKLAQCRLGLEPNALKVMEISRPRRSAKDRSESVKRISIYRLDNKKGENDNLTRQEIAEIDEWAAALWYGIHFAKRVSAIQKQK